MAEIPFKPELVSKATSPVTPQGKTPDKALSGAFAKILADQLEAPLAAGSTEAQGLPELTASFSLDQLNALGDQKILANEISQTLDGLDTYVQWLAHPEKSLRETSGLLDDLSARIANLESRANEGADPELKGIVSHLSTLVAVEKTKLDRGDYL